MPDLPSLLPPNVNGIERDLEQMFARMQGLSTPLSYLWNPDECLEHVLPYLAWALSIEIWDDTWTECQKREMIKSSIAIHRLKGTRGAVERALQSLGFSVELTEWFETGGAPHTFQVNAYGENIVSSGGKINSKTYDQVKRLIEHVKPAHTDFELSIGETVKVSAQIGVGVRDFYHDEGLILLVPPLDHVSLSVIAGTALTDTYIDQTNIRV